MKHKVVAEKILDSVGGKDNVINAVFCATRLRVVVKDNDLVDAEKVETLKEDISGYFYQSGQHQFIIGTGNVNKVHAEFTKLLPQEIEGDFKEDAFKEMTPIQKVFRVLADILVPLIPALVTTGLLMGLRGFVLNLGVEMNEEFLTLFTMLTDTAFAFLPVLITYSATLKFGGNPILGIVVGLMMVAPQIPNAWAVSSGDAQPMVISLFGLSLKVIGYQGSVLPGIFAGWLISTLEKKLRKVIPSLIDLIITPFFTILISIFVVLLIIGPVLHNLELGATNLLLLLTKIPFGIGHMIFGAIQQVIVITGMHHAIGVIEIQLLSTVGSNVIQPLTTASMAGQFGAAIGVMALLKNKKKKANTLSAAIPTLFGITEPLLFGVNLPRVKAFVAGMIGGAVGGLVTFILSVAPNGMGVTFIPGLLFYTSSLTDFLGYIAVIASSFVVGLAMTRILIKEAD
ncbi:MAG TPA: PTS transporter subunit EIIC [Erysipelothrix sp.]|nr:PTS transporter subunit EIIC [Erysipelothrix sp.]